MDEADYECQCLPLFLHYVRPRSTPGRICSPVGCVRDCGVEGSHWLGLLVRSVLAFAIPLINALFLYILCARSILSK